MEVEKSRSQFLKKTIALFLVLVMIAAFSPSGSLSVSTAAGDPPELEFSFREAPLPTLYDVVWGEEMFVGVGADGAILTSPDGVEWSRTTSAPAWLVGKNIIAVTHGQRGFVAVTDDGAVIQSSNGYVWTGKTGVSKAGLYDIAHRGGRYTAVGASGTIITSTDLVTWDILDSGTTEFLSGVHITEDALAITIAVGINGTILTSDNLIDWRSRTSGTTNLLRSATCRPLPSPATGRQIVVVGGGGTVLTSVDQGVNWTAQASGTPFGMRNVEYFAGLLHAVGDNGRVWTSSDAVTWSEHVYRNHFHFSLNSIAYNDKKSLANATVAVGSNGFVYRKPEIGNWSRIRGGAPTTLRDVQFANNRYFAVGSTTTYLLVGGSWNSYGMGFSLYSDDGTEWMPTISGPPAEIHSATTRTPRGNVFVGGLGGKVYTTEDGAVWTDRSSAYTHPIYDMISIPIGVSGRRLIAVGHGAFIQYTDDGENWIHRSSLGILDYNGLTRFAKDGYAYLVGDDGLVMRSATGHDWSFIGNIAAQDFNAIDGNDSLLVIVGQGGAIWTSTSGNVHEWIARNSGTTRDLHDVTWTGDRFIAVGTHGVIRQSWDGANWYSTPAITHAHLYGVYAHEDQVSIVGDQMTILMASMLEPIPPVERISGANRFATAIEISQQGWEDGSSPYVLLARSHDFADALAGVPLAHALNAPILLVDTNVVYGSILAEIERLGAMDVILLGGTGAISDDVKAFLEGHGKTVERLAGTGRYATAAAIAQRLEDEVGPLTGAVIAVGTDFPDALSAASYAAMQGHPILLTHPTILPGATQDAIVDLGIQDLVVAGGEAAVSSDVFDALTVSGSKIRVSDTNRYTTAVAMAEHFDPGARHYFLATGTDFPDAITGAVLAARRGTGVLLVWGPGSNPGLRVETFFTDYGVEGVTLFGGSGAIGAAMEAWMEDFFTPDP